MMTAAIEKNCLEHISLMAQEQIELEFREELQQLQQVQMQTQQNPQILQQNPQMQQQMQLTPPFLLQFFVEAAASVVAFADFVGLIEDSSVLVVASA